MRGVAASTLVVLAACTSDLPDLSRDDAGACAELTAALPDRVAGEDIIDDTDRAARWGGIELTCGVGVPAAYDDFADCTVVGDVGWFLPPAELKDAGVDIVATALTWSPRVSVLIPAEHRGSDEVLAAIAPAITSTLTEGKPCL
ncbi:DUF3515 family protein [Nocardioides currus]|uniref:DUF3515 domain-containing protein n=1 Tax=Nocardioides currus TaxID=2133958 RepID=A0A2R7YWK9_9ACTN|nr:DUF3515 family protein [Nocardioides currus]PUA80752.1 hypothetical protein C7S10_13490 [Nocardioides currus]